jgi:hypothetical protein
LEARTFKRRKKTLLYSHVGKNLEHIVEKENNDGTRQEIVGIITNIIAQTGRGSLGISGNRDSKTVTSEAVTSL